MTPKEIMSKILSYESRIIDFRERSECDKDYNYEERIDQLIKMQVALIENYKKEALTDFLDFLLKEGYCDTDVYCEPPTAIDQYLIFNKK